MKISSILDLQKISNQIKKILLPGDTIFLYGQIGVGKTTFARLLINNYENEKKLKKSEVLSPTFNIMFGYDIKDFTIEHYDLYRIKNEKEIKLFNNYKKGLGGAINMGIEKSTGEVICIMMSDLSDDISDLKKYYSLIQAENIDAVFGSRFINGSKVVDYPIKKLILNRIFNYFTKFIFLSDYNDFTNAFKIYKKKALTRSMPLISESFIFF